MASRVAIITGGAMSSSGMGLAVAQALSERGNWTTHIFDLNEESGKEVASKLQNTVFHHADVADYAAQASAFKSAFIASGRRLDFVFANAGVIETKNFYAKHETGDEPPPSPDLLSVDVDLKGVVYTSYLALHHFRQSPKEGRDASLVLTASCGSLYPADYSPMYTAANHGVSSLLRSIASHCRLDDIRADAICPGIVETNLVGPGGWSNFPRNLFTPLSKIVDVVLQMIDGSDLLDANGVQVSAGKAYGQAVEISLDKHSIRTVPDFCDDAMKAIMEATSVENQRGGVIKD